MEEDLYNRITLRIPRELDAKLDAEAERTTKSKNAEIISRLRQSFEIDSPGKSARQSLMALAETIKNLGDESEALLGAIAAMADIAERAAGHISDPVAMYNVTEAAKLARTFTAGDPGRFSAVQAELLELAKSFAEPAADPDAPAPSRPRLVARKRPQPR